MESPIAPGEYEVAVWPSIRQRGSANLCVLQGERDVVLDLVVWAELESIEGLIVDEGGRPVEGAQVRSAAGGPSVPSGSDGSFRLPRFETQPEDPVRLQVEKSGFEPFLSQALHSWGAKNVTLILVCLARHTVEVLAVEADSGQPLAEFALRQCPRNPRDGHFKPSLQSTRNPQGRMLVENVMGGENVFVVEPTDDRFWASEPVLVNVTEYGAPLQRIEVPRAGRRGVLVVDRAGAPVVGTRVELLQVPAGVEVSLGTKISSGASWNLWGPWILGPFLVQGGHTDGVGRLDLRGPAGVGLTLRLLGPGHAPISVEGVVLEGPELRVEVEASATVKGVLLPRGFAARFLPPASAGSPAAPEMVRAMLPSLRLVRSSGREGLPADPARIQPDDSFLLENVPPGDWDVEIVWASPFFMSTLSARLGAIEGLVAGELRRIELDGSAILPATLTGRVFLDGEPHASAAAVLFCRRPGLVAWGRQVDQASLTLRTDERGVFVARVPPGSFAVAVPFGPGSPSRRVPGEEWVEVGPGESVHRDFHVKRRSLIVRIRSFEGEPEADRTFMVVQERQVLSSFTTDGQGVLVVDPVPAGPFELAAWPKKLAGREEQAAYIQAHPWPEWLSVLSRLGPIEPANIRKDTQLELRLERESE